MRISKVLEAWKEDRLALGTLIKSIDPVHTEIVSQLEFDFLWYDLEHSDKSLETFSNLCRASRTGDVDILARPARWEFMRMGRLLEAGAQGIMYPRCESEEEAREVVRWAKFHPLGERGFDGGSADNRYGQYSADKYTEEANRETWMAIQIESPEALPNVGEIAAVDGVDCIFFGPGDFSVLSGVPGQIKHPTVLNAAKEIAQATLASGKVFGTLVFDMEHSNYMQDIGAKMIIHTADVVLYKQAYQNVLGDYFDRGEKKGSNAKH